MKTKIISILWWSLTHPVALLTTLAKLGCSLAIIFAIVVSVCEIKIDFIEQGKKALISEIFNAGYSSNSSLTVASLRDFEDYDYDYESNLSFKIDPEQGIVSWELWANSCGKATLLLLTLELEAGAGAGSVDGASFLVIAAIVLARPISALMCSGNKVLLK